MTFDLFQLSFLSLRPTLLLTISRNDNTTEFTLPFHDWIGSKDSCSSSTQDKDCQWMTLSSSLFIFYALQVLFNSVRSSLFSSSFFSMREPRPLFCHRFRETMSSGITVCLGCSSAAWKRERDRKRENDVIFVVIIVYEKLVVSYTRREWSQAFYPWLKPHWHHHRRIINTQYSLRETRGW